MFSTNPIRLIATMGRDVSLECRPRASPKPRITWKKNDRRVQPSRRWVSAPTEASWPLWPYLFAWKCNNSQVSLWSGDRPILGVCVFIGFQLKMLINTHRFTWICVDGSFNRCCCPLIMGLTLGCVLLSWQVCLRSQLGGWFALQGCIVIDAYNVFTSYYSCCVCICVNICVCFIMLTTT